MEKSTQALIGRVISIEQLEPRLELAAAKKTEVSVEGSYGPGGCTVSVKCTISF